MGRMPFRGRLAAWANVLLPSAGAGLALLWVFAFRFSSLWRALLFALSMAGLLGYGLYLLQFRARPQGKQALREERRRAVQALARWETERALRAGFAALAQRHQLRCIGEGPGLLLAQDRGETGAVALLQALDQTGLRDVQAFDRRRGGFRGVLLCCGPIRPEARAYAAALQPALALLPLEELPLQSAGILPEAEAGRRAGVLRSALERALRRERAPLYIQAALLLLSLFILTDRLLYLWPGLLLLACMSLCAVKHAASPGLFS